MPICKGCGGSFDDNFKFCPYCGRAKPEPESLKIQVSVSTEIRWETCKICYREWETSLWRVEGWWGEFWASAIGPNGKYIAGESPVFLIKEGTNIAHSFLIERLSRDGWEAIAIPSGEKWWETPFRRQVKENNPRPWKTWQVDAYKKEVPYKRVTLVHSPDHIKPPRGSKYVHWPNYGKSTEFENSFWKGFDTGETEERRKIVEEFLQKMIGEGFELVEPSLIEKFKKAITDNVRKNWYYHVLLKRE
jgi:hypothetical protein